MACSSMAELSAVNRVVGGSNPLVPAILNKKETTMKVFDPKTKRNIVVFKEYELDENAQACPECHRSFKEYDIKRLAENSRMSCSKCGAKLKRK